MIVRRRPRPTGSDSQSDSSSYLSADPATDPRRLSAGCSWNTPAPLGFPVRTAAGEWMIPVIIDLPYAMLASLEAAAQSAEFGDIVRAALVAIGHGRPDDIKGVQSDRFARLDECCDQVDMTPR